MANQKTVVPESMKRLLLKFLAVYKGTFHVQPLNDNFFIATQNPRTGTVWAELKKKGKETVWIWKNQNGRRIWLYRATERDNEIEFESLV